jgi:hypothetical protein
MKNIVLALFFMISFSVLSQKDLKSDASFTSIFGLNYKANFSGGSMAKRWGFTNTVGANVDFKFKNGFTFGVDGGFMFGSKFKQHEIFDNVINSFGTITTQGGTTATVLFLMRGMNVNGTIGYVFNRFGHNANSGIWINAGAGFLSHKIRVETQEDMVVNLEGDYLKGYDHLTMGVNTKQFVGYLFQNDKRFLNFYVGVEFIQGFTRNVRNYNFHTKGPESDLQIDMINSVKFGWMIPIYKRRVQNYYID